MNTQKVLSRIVPLMGAGWIAVACTNTSMNAARPVEAQATVSQELRNDHLGPARSLRRLRPFVRCVEAHGDEFLAHFGYRNRGDVALSVPIGRHNAFHPGPADRGQPKNFSVGRYDDVVQVAFGKRGLAVWELGLRVATASRHGRRCRPGAQCGDGQLDCSTDLNGSAQCEQCDDGNVTSGDGCSSTCTNEADWTCDDPGQACRRVVCGDGYVDCSTDMSGNEYCEDCDDDNVQAGDGCSASCVVEADWSCPDVGQPCESLCGSGAIDCWAADGGQQCEACDDGNAAPGDGCSAACVVEADWNCPTVGQPCETLCGSGAIDCWAADGGQQCEACDDGNVTSGDGCSSTCTVDPEWHCPVPGQPCWHLLCGNGRLESAQDGGFSQVEQCDDGNTQGGDGCSGSCIIESGCICSTPGQACACPGLLPGIYGGVYHGCAAFNPPGCIYDCMTIDGHLTVIVTQASDGILRLEVHNLPGMRPGQFVGPMQATPTATGLKALGDYSCPSANQSPWTGSGSLMVDVDIGGISGTSTGQIIASCKAFYHGDCTGPSESIDLLGFFAAYVPPSP